MNSDSFRIERPRSLEQFEEFARLPFEIYGGRAAWWPPEVRNEIDLLAGNSPLSPALEIEPLCARVNGKIACRAIAIVNRHYVAHWNEPLGHLIGFEALEGFAAAVRATIDAAAEWLRGRGMRAMRSGFAAFLDYPYAIDGYGELPSFLLRGNPPSYHRYLKSAGFETEKGQLDFTIALARETIERYRRMAAADPGGFAIRSWREYGFAAAIDAWTSVTNAAFDRHWGWNPVTHDEARPMLAPLAATPVADLSMLAVRDGEPVGAVFSVPDLSPMLARIKAGLRLDPARGGGTRGALINIGVIEGARGHGVAMAMAARSFLAMAERGMRYAGYTLVLDDNWASRRTAAALGARVTGNFVTYRRNL